MYIQKSRCKQYMKQEYDTSKPSSPSSYITYLDANSLYGRAMCKSCHINVSNGYTNLMRRK